MEAIFQYCLHLVIKFYIMLPEFIVTLSTI